MPVRDRRLAHGRAPLSVHARDLLKYGLAHDPPWPGCEQVFGKRAAGDRRARVASEENRDELLAWFSDNYPGTRPKAFWWFTAAPWQHLDSDPDCYGDSPKDETEVLDALGMLTDDERAALRARTARYQLAKAGQEQPRPIPDVTIDQAIDHPQTQEALDRDPRPELATSAEADAEPADAPTALPPALRRDPPGEDVVSSTPTPQIVRVPWPIERSWRPDADSGWEHHDA